jgi:hypothetical protein
MSQQIHHARNWVFGTINQWKAKAKRVDYSDITEKMKDAFNIEGGSPPTDVMAAIFQKYLADAIPANDLWFIKDLLVGDALLSDPDARCAIADGTGFIGVDLGLQDYLHNCIFLFFTASEFEIPDIIAKTENGICDDTLVSKLWDEIEMTLSRKRSVHDLFSLPSSDRFTPMCNISMFMKLYLIAHEIGHIVMSPYMDRQNNDYRHSLLYGFVSSGGTSNAGALDVEKYLAEHSSEIFNSWQSEIIADRYAVGLLKRITISREISEILIFFAAYALDVLTHRALVNSAHGVGFLSHPPPYLRAQLMGLNPELAKAHIRHIGPEPFHAIAKAYGAVSDMLISGDVIDDFHKAYFVWVTKFFIDDQWSARLIAGVEHAELQYNSTTKERR